MYQVDTQAAAGVDALRPVSESGDLLQRLDQLVEIGVALSSERDINKLLESILVAAKSITNADGGTLYRMQDGRDLKFEIYSIGPRQVESQLLEIGARVCSLEVVPRCAPE